MYHITLSKEIKQNCPEFRGAAVFAEVTNTPYCEGLWQEIATFTQELRARETTDSIKYQPVIAATREAYKRCVRWEATLSLLKKCLKVWT